MGTYSKRNNMSQQTAVEWLVEKLQAPCRGIPSHIVEQAKQMEKEQIKNAYKADVTVYPIVQGIYEAQAEQYYNEIYGK